MKLSRAEAAVLIRGALGVHLDDLLGEEGFRRGRTSLEYRRSIDDGGAQGVDFRFEVRPSFAPEDIHLDPVVTIDFPQLNALAQRMLGGDASLLGLPTTVRAPLQSVAPRGSNIWLGRDEGSLLAAVEAIRRMAIPIVLDGLRQATSHHEFVSAAQRRDPNIYRSGSIGSPWMQVAAARIIAGDSAAARATIEEHYPGRSPLDRRYRTALQWIEENEGDPTAASDRRG